MTYKQKYYFNEIGTVTLFLSNAKKSLPGTALTNTKHRTAAQPKHAIKAAR
jgi:hypothetical protein